MRAHVYVRMRIELHSTYYIVNATQHVYNGSYMQQTALLCMLMMAYGFTSIDKNIK